MEQKEDKGLSVRLKGKQRENEPKIKAHSASRISLFWAILKGRFGRLMFINLLMLLSALPVVALVVYRFIYLAAGEMVGPYGAGLTVGYPVISPKYMIGLLENHILRVDIFIFALLIPASAIFAVGLSAGMYICRNLVRTEGIYLFSDLKRGIKQNFLPVLEGVLLFTVLLFLAQTVADVADFQIAMGGSKGWFITSKVIGYVIMSFILLVGLWMISLGIEYKLGFFSLLRNAIVLTVGTFPQTLLFAAIAIAPVFLLLFTSGFWFAIGLIFYIIVGFSMFMMIWMTYSSWVLDKFLTLEQQEETKKPTTNNKSVQQAAPSHEEVMRLISAYGKSTLLSKPIAPIEEGSELIDLGESFSRADLRKLSDARAELTAEANEFAKAHISEPRYVEYNQRFEQREKALDNEKGKKKAPKRPPKALNQ